MSPRRSLVALAAVVALWVGQADSAALAAGPGNGANAGLSARAAHFQVGAGVADFTPPPFGRLRDQHGNPIADPADCVAGTPAESVYDGPRAFSFEEPYIDKAGTGHYDLGDPFVDCNHDGRWDGNFLGGGSNAPRYYSHVADPVQARAMVVSNGRKTIAVEVLDQEGVFNVYQQRIRDTVNTDLPGALDDIYVSATHDESAPDTLGLYGPALGAAGQSAPASVTSSVNPYFVDYMVRKSADAIESAFGARHTATVKLTEAIEPANLRQCWSSYPFIDDQLMPTLQAVDAAGKAIVTLVSISQHSETLGFNPPTSGDPVLNQKQWITADLPHFVRQRLEQAYGGVGIVMAGSVGSVETPQVFSGMISRTPQQFVDASHPAGCRTLFTGNGTPAPLGYSSEDVALGDALGGAVISALHASSQASRSDDIWGERADVCIPVSNALFLVAGGAGIFAQRPGYVAGCAVQVPVSGNGSTAANEIKSEVAAFRIGDAEFLALPGEVFPFTFLRGFLGPEDMPFANFAMPPWLMAHMHTPYRFLDGLAEDMIGYVFPQGNGVGVPGEYPATNPQADSTDRFGCGHSDDSEAANSQAADIIGNGLVPILDRHGAAEDIALGRYLMPNGSVSRDPLGGPEVKCQQDTTFAASGAAVAVRLADGTTVKPAHWMSLSGRVQAIPDRNTRGWIDAAGARHWLDVFPDLAPPANTPDVPAAALLPLLGMVLVAAMAGRRRSTRLGRLPG